MPLQHTVLLKVVVDGDGQDAGGDLRQNVGDGVIIRNATVVEGHDGHGGVEVTAGDGAAQEGQDGQGRADGPRVARGDDDGQEDERTQEFHEDGQEVHCWVLSVRNKIIRCHVSTRTVGFLPCPTRIRNCQKSGFWQQATGDVHGFQLLEEQLVRIRNADLTEFRRVPAARTLPDVAGFVGDGDETASLTDLDLKVVGGLHHALLEECGGAVRNHDVTLHLSKAESSVAGAALGGLAGQHDQWASTATMQFITNHVLQPLIENRARKDGGRHLFARVATVEHLVTVRLQATLEEFVGDVVHRHVFVEWSRVAQEAGLTTQTA